MEILADQLGHRNRITWIMAGVSIGLHLIAFTMVLWSSLFAKNSSVPLDVIDITLFDMSSLETGSETAMSLEKESTQPEKPVAKKKDELTDPSEAELTRMRKRDQIPKQTPQKEDETEFGMQSGFLPGGSGQTKGSLKLDAAQFPFVYYLSMMKSRISENWIPPFGSVTADESKKVTIRFRVDRWGMVLSPEIEESSGDDLLDQSALRAVIVSGPFPPLPEGYPDATLGVHFGFICHL
ncbi:TonB family protein [bacterium]|nr:TonB family protein [candidate division CSSED10-310 bacterium]